MPKQAKLYYPLMIWMCQMGYTKQLAFFHSLKLLYESGHVWNYRKFKKIEGIGFNLCRNTYKKYIITLQELGLAYADKNGGLHLSGQKHFYNEFPPEKDNHKYFYLDNNKESLKDGIERIILEQNIVSQRKEISRNSRYNVPLVKEYITKNVRGESYTYNIDRTNDTNISTRTFASMIGFKSWSTAAKRINKWDQSGFIDKVPRTKYIGHITDTSTRELISSGIKLYIFNHTGDTFEVLSTEINIRNGRIGKKQIINKTEGKKCFCNNALFDEWF